MDLDGDGQLDIISGSWPGELFFFKGGSDRTFAAPTKLKYKNGKTINIGGGRMPDSGDMILVAGDAKFENLPGGGNVIIYEGERIEIPKGKSGGITGRASAVFATDWDGDGDLDLLVGVIDGNIWLVPNEGTAKAPAFGKEVELTAGGKKVNVGHDAGPCVADWDGDGKPDLLAGAGDGSVWFFRNTGTPQKPELGAGEVIVPAGEAKYGADAPKETVRGTRSKVCVADWNGDGRLDLLLGDFATQKPNLTEPTAEQKAEHDKLRKKQETVTARYQELYQKVYGTTKIKDEAERKKAEKEFQEVMQEMSTIRGKLPKEYENHGWVWVFLRKPAERAAGAQE